MMTRGIVTSGMQRLLATLFALLSLLPARHSVAEEPGIRTFEVSGVVRAVDTVKKSARIAHEEIPGYMRAMTMDLAVRDDDGLAGLKPGDAITFRMCVTEDDGWIEHIRTSAGTGAPEPSKATRLQQARALAPLVPGDTLPDHHFISASGETVRLGDYRGAALAITFIFTRCPFPTYCPRLSAHMASARERLQNTPDAPENWHFASITLDPAFDTPERLGHYAAQYHATPDHWQFLTGEPAEIEALAARFGVEYWQDNPEAPLNHTLRTAVIDANGRVQWIQSGSDWKPETLVKQVMKAARVESEERK